MRRRRLEARAWRPEIVYFVAFCIAAKNWDSWSSTPVGVSHSFIVAASGPILIVVASLVYGPLYALQPPEPATLPSSRRSR